MNGSRPEPPPPTAGDRVLVPCEGGPCVSRLEVFPPRLEIPESEGLYVLDDSGPPRDWKYVFIPRE